LLVYFGWQIDVSRQNASEWNAVSYAGDSLDGKIIMGRSHIHTNIYKRTNTYAHRHRRQRHDKEKRTNLL